MTAAQNQQDMSLEANSDPFEIRARPHKGAFFEDVLHETRATKGVVQMWPFLGNKQTRGSGRRLRAVLGRQGCCAVEAVSLPVQARWF